MEALENRKEICVDTDVLIDFLKKKEPGSRTYERWRGKAALAITPITAFELLFGSKQSSLTEKRSNEAMSLIEQHLLLPFDKSAAERASEIGVQLRQKGEEIEIRDLFIASICVSQGIPILTKNKQHFERVPGLAVMNVS